MFISFVVPGQLFGIFLAVFLVIVALLVWFRSPRSEAEDNHPHHPARLLTGVGLG